ncbi:MAG: diaminopimelate epimerase [Rikenellaceae bacterium]|nr:diaminopimelate epimerase [Rikenellaceae bacterium]
MILDFSKYEGAGNDFVLVDGREGNVELTREETQALCDRHFGIGADGLMILGRSDRADFSMRYFNSDGRGAEMCGNGARCIALFAHHLGIGGERKRFEGADGMHTARVESLSHHAGTVTIGMRDVERVEHGDGYLFLDTGVPHYVAPCDDLRGVDVHTRGAAVRYDPRWSATGGTNVDFMQLLAEGRIAVRTYERGVEGETLACGTGATAAAIAAHLLTGGLRTRFEVGVEGGLLEVWFTPCPDGRFREIHLKGPARKVFEGRIDTNNFAKK